MVKAVVGANWGDEGKGKITDMLAERVRYYHSFPGWKQMPDIQLSMIMANLRFIRLPSGVFYQSYNQYHRKWCCFKYPGSYQGDPVYR